MTSPAKMLLQSPTATPGRPGSRAARRSGATGTRTVPARRSSLVALILTALITVALALPLDNWAGTGRPRPWPGGVISYWDASGWKETVPVAVAQWNRSAAAVRFVEARSRADADVVIVSDSRKVDHLCRKAHLSRNGNSCAGYATTVGYPDDGNARVLLGDHEPGSLDGPSAQDVRLVVHELGHILGLEHRSSCHSVMNHSSALPGCDHKALLSAAPSPAVKLCGPFPSDVAAASRLYGTSRRHGSRWC